MKKWQVSFLSLFNIFVCILSVVAMVNVLKNAPINELTDGIVTAVFDEEAGTLTFSGNGAVDSSSGWLEGFKQEERVFVRTIVFEDGITSIGSVEFSDNRGYINLEKVIFRGDINTIDSCAFSGNRNLTTVEFGGGCKVIENLAFFKCSSLESINIPDGCSVDRSAFSQTPLDERKSEEVAIDYSQKDLPAPPPEMPPAVKEP